jgi:alkyldihydroxyacetonephosphate synthase
MHLTDVRSSDDPLERLAVSRDLWPGGTLESWVERIDPPLPARVFWPRDAAEVHAVLRAAAASRIPVVTWGAGSGVCGGARGRADAWVLDTRRLDAIGPLDPERLSVRVGAGVNGQQLEDWLGARGFTLGHSPSSIACSTVGGWAAARSAGQFSSKYGVFEDMVLGLVAVTPERGVVRVGEGGDAPPGWLELLLGSEGTLAVITELELRIWRAPRARWLRGYRVADVGTAVGLMRSLLQAELHPSAVRLYDPVDTRIGGRTRPKKQRGEGSASFVRRWLQRVDALPEVHRRTLALPLSLPGVVNRILDGVAGGCLLVVGFEGDPEVVEVTSAAGHAIVAAGAEDLGPEPGERWYASRHAVSYKLMPVFERGGFADTMEVGVRWSELEATWRAVREALAPHAVVMAHMSHLYPEGGSLYFSFAGRGDRETYRTVWDTALRAVLDAGATTTHHHGVGELKAAAATEEVGPAIAGWSELRAKLDPHGILNPGRLFRPDLGPPRAAPRFRPPAPTDGLAQVPASADLPTRAAVGEPLWPTRTWPGLPRWQRSPWQTPWTEVEGPVDGVWCRLGRGPRSAAGPDLRPWLFAHGAVTVAYPAALPGPRALGRIRLPSPWKAARELLRADLRPGALFVREGWLYVGFRGAAAESLLAVAGRRLGALERVPWEVVPPPDGPLERCADDDPAAVHATAQSAFRAVAGAPPAGGGA